MSSWIDGAASHAPFIPSADEFAEHPSLTRFSGSGVERIRNLVVESAETLLNPRLLKPLVARCSGTADRVPYIAPMILLAQVFSTRIRQGDGGSALTTFSGYFGLATIEYAYALVTSLVKSGTVASITTAISLKPVYLSLTKSEVCNISARARTLLEKMDTFEQSDVFQFWVEVKDTVCGSWYDGSSAFSKFIKAGTTPISNYRTPTLTVYGLLTTNDHARLVSSRNRSAFSAYTGYATVQKAIRSAAAANATLDFAGSSST
eukprot:2868068-Amphidinium_carterae.1